MFARMRPDIRKELHVGAYLGQHWRRLGQNGYDISVRTEIYIMQTGGVNWRHQITKTSHPASPISLA